MEVLQKQRARTRDDKRLRREAILAAARTVLERTPPQKVTVGDLADAAALGKTTLYSYFETKEDVLLSLFEAELVLLIDDMCARLEGVVGIEAVASALVAAVGAQRGYRRMAVALHTQIEPNVSPERRFAFRRVLAAEVLRAGRAIEARVPELPPGGGAVTLRRLQSLALGLDQLVRPGGVPLENPEDPALEPFRLRFGDELQNALTCLLIGMTDPRGVAP